MKPDICFLDENGRPALIVDSKWKLLDHKQVKLGLAQSDLYQIQSYGNRYGVSSLCLVYPQQVGCERQYTTSISGEVARKVFINSVDIGMNQDIKFLDSIKCFMHSSFDISVFPL